MRASPAATCCGGACLCLQAPGRFTSSLSIACRLQAAARVISEAVSSAGVFASPKAAAYWTYHLSRSSFFLLQGAAGALLPRCIRDGLVYAVPGCVERA